MVVLNTPNGCPESDVDSLPNSYSSNDSANPGILIDTIEYSSWSPGKVSELIDLARPTAKLVPEVITLRCGQKGWTASSEITWWRACLGLSFLQVALRTHGSFTPSQAHAQTASQR